MATFSLILVLITVCALPKSFCQEWELVFEDEFNGDAINQDNWQWEITATGGGNAEFQVYTPAPENSFVRDGKLFIQPTLLENNINPRTGEVYGPEFLTEGELDLNATYSDFGGCTNSENNGCYRTGLDDDGLFTINPVASARIRSYQRFPFRYGKAEVFAKMPVGDWLWPALWFLPENWCYGDWPTSGEFDLVETIGNDELYFEDGEAAGIQKMGSTLHWGVDRQNNRYHLTHNSNINETSDYGQFHLYEVEWTPNGFSFFVDGALLLNVPSPLIDENPEWEGFWEFGKPWIDINDTDPEQNPWKDNNEALMSPFDTQFHFLLNVAVGGTNGFIPDNAINRGGDPAFAKPWTNDVPQVPGMNSFYDARGEDDTSGWLWTWDSEEENNAMQVEYVRVYKHSDLPAEGEQDCPVPEY